MTKCLFAICCAIMLCIWFAFMNQLVPTRTDKLLAISGIKAHSYHRRSIFHDYWMDVLGYTDGYEILIIPASCIDTIQPYNWSKGFFKLSEFNSKPFRGMSNEMWEETYEKSASFINGEDEYTIMLSPEHCAIYRVHHKACY